MSLLGRVEDAEGCAKGPTKAVQPRAVGQAQ